jgi:NADPH-dependent ferric siderophore reductase
MTANLPAAATQPDRTPKRVRHTLRFRALEVIKTERITPHLLRLTVGGDELADFVSPGFDDHVKLFFPDANGVLSLPTAGPGRMASSRPCAITRRVDTILSQKHWK